jgi:hypothetical protein
MVTTLARMGTSSSHVLLYNMEIDFFIIVKEYAKNNDN